MPIEPVQEEVARRAGAVLASIHEVAPPGHLQPGTAPGEGTASIEQRDFAERTVHEVLDAPLTVEKLNALVRTVT